MSVALMVIIYAAIIVFFIAACWKLLVKAGYPGREQLSPYITLIC